MADVTIKRTEFGFEVKLNRPKKHNAFTPKIINDLTEFFTSLENDKTSRAILFSGIGPSFCAGADLEWMKASVKYTTKKNEAEAKELFEMFEVMANCPIPILGYVHGNVYGGGVGLAAVCDIVAAEINTKFCLSEVRLGLAPAVISSFVASKVHANRLKEYMLTAKVFSADEALSAGLIEFVGRELEARTYLNSSIELLLNNGPQAVRASKRHLQWIKQNDPKKVKAQSIHLIAERRASAEGQEGLKSFFSKKKVKWITSIKKAIDP